MSRARSSLSRHETDLRAALSRALSVALALTPGACTRDGAARSTGPRDAAVDHVDPCKPTLAAIHTGIVDGANECIAWQRHACGIPADIAPVDGGCSFSVADCQRLCPSFGASSCRATDASCADGVLSPSVLVACDFCVGGIGRRPAGLAPEPAEASGLGAHFASMAHLEAASVLAFVELRRALARHRAPRALLRACTRALADERRHARAAARLARRFGGAPATVRLAPRHTPSLETLATENAVEGEVGETYGALALTYMAERAADPDVARTLRSIADDETRHAALSRAIAAWVAPRLDDAARVRVEAARRRAEESLIQRAPGPSVTSSTLAGLPDGRTAARLAAALFGVPG